MYHQASAVPQSVVPPPITPQKPPLVTPEALHDFYNHSRVKYFANVGRALEVVEEPKEIFKADQDNIDPKDHSIQERKIKEVLDEQVQAKFQSQKPESLAKNPIIFPSGNLKETTIFFNSRFESGNLREVEKLNEFEYNCYVNFDFNSTTHSQWFFFSVRNIGKGRQYKFNIMNLQKDESCYQIGMKPFVYSTKKNRNNGTNLWKRGCDNVCYYRNKLRTKVRECAPDYEFDEENIPCYEYEDAASQMVTLNTLSFCYEFEIENDITYFAYFQPYTLSDLEDYLFMINKKFDSDHLQEIYKCQKLCNTVGGKPCYVLTITDNIKEDDIDPEALLETQKLNALDPNKDSYQSNSIQIPAGGANSSRGVEAGKSSGRTTAQNQKGGKDKGQGNTDNGEEENTENYILSGFQQMAKDKKDFDPANHQKQTVFLTARVHPGESNASFMIQGAIDFLLQKNNKEAKLLRETFIFKIIPMLNPDGVVNGNYRCNFVGADLNRRWPNPSKLLHPTIYYTKKLLKMCHQDNQVLLFCDFHGHTRKRNVFMYGCVSPQTEVNQHKNNNLIRIVPYLLDQKNKLFSFADCKFANEKEKNSTGRLVMFNEFGILNSYTIESTFYSHYHPRMGQRKKVNVEDELQIKVEELVEIGNDFCEILTSIINSKILKRKFIIDTTTPLGSMQPGQGGNPLTQFFQNQQNEQNAQKLHQLNSATYNQQNNVQSVIKSFVNGPSLNPFSLINGPSISSTLANGLSNNYSGQSSNIINPSNQGEQTNSNSKQKCFNKKQIVSEVQNKDKDKLAASQNNSHQAHKSQQISQSTKTIEGQIKQSQNQRESSYSQMSQKKNVTDRLDNHKIETNYLTPQKDNVSQIKTQDVKMNQSLTHKPSITGIQNQLSSSVDWPEQPKSSRKIKIINDKQTQILQQQAPQIIKANQIRAADGQSLVDTTNCQFKSRQQQLDKNVESIEHDQTITLVQKKFKSSYQVTGNSDQQLTINKTPNRQPIFQMNTSVALDNYPFSNVTGESSADNANKIFQTQNQALDQYGQIIVSPRINSMVASIDNNPTVVNEQNGPNNIVTSNNHPLFFKYQAQEENTPMFDGGNNQKGNHKNGLDLKVQTFSQATASFMAPHSAGMPEQKIKKLQNQMIIDDDNGNLMGPEQMNIIGQYMNDNAQQQENSPTLKIDSQEIPIMDQELDASVILATDASPKFTREGKDISQNQRKSRTPANGPNQRIIGNNQVDSASNQYLESKDANGILKFKPISLRNRIISNKSLSRGSTDNQVNARQEFGQEKSLIGDGLLTDHKFQTPNISSNKACVDLNGRTIMMIGNNNLQQKTKEIMSSTQNISINDSNRKSNRQNLIGLREQKSKSSLSVIHPQGHIVKGLTTPMKSYNANQIGYGVSHNHKVQQQFQKQSLMNSAPSNNLQQVRASLGDNNEAINSAMVQNFCLPVSQQDQNLNQLQKQKQLLDNQQRMLQQRKYQAEIQVQQISNNIMNARQSYQTTQSNTEVAQNLYPGQNFKLKYAANSQAPMSDQSGSNTYLRAQQIDKSRPSTMNSNPGLGIPYSANYVLPNIVQEGNGGSRIAQNYDQNRPVSQSNKKEVTQNYPHRNIILTGNSQNQGSFVQHGQNNQISKQNQNENQNMLVNSQVNRVLNQRGQGSKVNIKKHVSNYEVPNTGPLLFSNAVKPNIGSYSVEREIEPDLTTSQQNGENRSMGITLPQPSQIYQLNGSEQDQRQKQ